MGACHYSLGPQLTLPVPLFLLPVTLFARSQVKAIIFLLGVGLVSWMEPSPLLGQPLPAAAALQAPSFAVPISAILQSGRNRYLLGLVLGGGGPWRRGGRLQVLWAQRKAQGVQRLMVWTDFRVQSGNRAVWGMNTNSLQRNEKGDLHVP